MLKSVLYRMPTLLLVVAPLVVPAWALSNFVQHWSVTVAVVLLWTWAVSAAVIVAGGAMLSIEVPPQAALRLALRRMPPILTTLLIFAVPIYVGFRLADSAGDPGTVVAVLTFVPLLCGVLFGLFALAIPAATLGGHANLSALRQSVAIVRKRFLPNMGRVLFFVLVIPLVLQWLASPVPPIAAVMWLLTVIIQAVALAHLYLTSPLVTQTTVEEQLRSTDTSPTAP